MNELTYEEKQYNLATTNFYLVVKTSLEGDITKAKNELHDCEIMSTLHDAVDFYEDQEAKANYYLGVLEQAKQTLAYVESVYNQSIIKSN
jgi:hypothetical protein